MLPSPHGNQTHGPRGHQRTGHTESEGVLRRLRIGSAR